MEVFVTSLTPDFGPTLLPGTCMVKREHPPQIHNKITKIKGSLFFAYLRHWKVYHIEKWVVYMIQHELVTWHLSSFFFFWVTYTKFYSVNSVPTSSASAGTEPWLYSINRLEWKFSLSIHRVRDINYLSDPDFLFLSIVQGRCRFRTVWDCSPI